MTTPCFLSFTILHRWHRRKSNREVVMKRLIGIIFIIAGILLLVFGFYEKGQINMKGSQANERIEKGQGLFQDNPVGNAVGGTIKEQVAEKVAHYQQMVMWIMI